MRKEENSRKLLFFLVLLFISSIFLLLFLGESRKTLVVGILYALLILPIEIYATVFFLNNLLKKREEVLEEARQDSYYFSIADQSQKQLIFILKKGLVESFLVNQLEEDIDRAFEYLYTNRATLLTADFWKNALVNQYKPFKDPLEKNKKVVPLVATTEIGQYITEEILDFYSIYLKFIPLDIFKELHGIYQILEVSILFSDNPYIMKQRYALVKKEKKKDLYDAECLELAEISKTIVEQVYLKIQTIEAITNEHYQKILE